MSNAAPSAGWEEPAASQLAGQEAVWRLELTDHAATAVLGEVALRYAASNDSQEGMEYKVLTALADAPTADGEPKPMTIDTLFREVTGISHTGAKGAQKTERRGRVDLLRRQVLALVTDTTIDQTPLIERRPISAAFAAQTGLCIGNQIEFVDTRERSQPVLAVTTLGAVRQQRQAEQG